MKLFSIDYNPEENEGVYALSVVKDPAMQSKWVMLSNQKKFKLAEVDSERRILMGIALIPNKPIYRNDQDGEYNIIFSSKSIEQAAHDFVKKGKVNNSTLEHEIDLGSDAVSVVESWIVEDAVHDKTRKFGFNEPVGSWAVMMKVHDDKVWEKAKNGEILGFSIDGLFNLKKVNMKKEVKSISLAERLGKFLISLAEVKLGSVNTSDGVAINFEGDELADGDSVFIENEGERVPLPVGDYELESGEVLVVAEEGVLGGYKAKEEEPEPDMELSKKEQDEFLSMLDKMFGLSEMKTQLADLKKENETLKVTLAEYGKTPAVDKVVAKVETQKVDLSSFKTKQARLYAQLKNQN